MKKNIKNKIILCVIATILLGMTIITNVVTFATQENPGANVTLVGGYPKDSNNIEATQNVPKEYNGIKTGDEIQFFTQTMFTNDEIYCVQNGRYWTGLWPWYKVGNYYTVSDPILAYILNMEEDTSTKEGDGVTSASIKNNMIWWYMNKYPNTTDTQNLKSNKNESEFPIKDNMTESELASYIQAAQNYANKVNNVSIAIDSIQKVGNNIQIKVSGTYDKFRLYINNSNEVYKEYSNGTATINIPINEFNSDDNKAHVKVQAMVNKYSAGYFVLIHDYNQTLICIANREQKLVVTDKAATKELTINTNVSLQKYITKVTDANGYITYTDTASRKNKYADTNANLGIDTSKYTHAGKNVSKNNAVTGINNYKVKNPVKIEVGDTVEYKIIVYNNSTIPAIVDVKDTVNSIGQVVSGVDGDGYIANDLELGANAEKEFTVKVKYETYTDDIVENIAYIDKTDPPNNNENRTYDEDYIKMKKYEVSLEKFIKGVNLNKQDSNVFIRYDSIISYIENSGNVANLLNKYNKVKDIKNNEGVYTYLIENGKVEIAELDLDGDGDVDNSDLELYKTYLKYIETKDVLNDYIEADLNGDGIVDIKDLEMLNSNETDVIVNSIDINRDGLININDLYDYELKRILQDENLKDLPIVHLLKILRLKSVAKIDLGTDDIASIYEGLYKSDVNDDGVVNSDDRVFIDKETTIYEDIDDFKITDFVMNDFNSDGKVDDLDVSMRTTEEGKINTKIYIDEHDFYDDGIVNPLDVLTLKVMKGMSIEEAKSDCGIQQGNTSYDNILEMVKKINAGEKEYKKHYETFFEYYDFDDDDQVTNETSDCGIVDDLDEVSEDHDFTTDFNGDYIYSDDFINYVDSFDFNSDGYINAIKNSDGSWEVGNTGELNILFAIIQERYDYISDEIMEKIKKSIFYIDGSVTYTDTLMFNNMYLCSEEGFLSNESPYLMLDFNSNGEIFETEDFELLSNNIIYRMNADTNEDGTIDIKDLYHMELFKIIASIDTHSLKIDDLPNYETEFNSSFINSEEFKNYIEQKYDLNSDGYINLEDSDILFDYVSQDINGNGIHAEAEDYEILMYLIEYLPLAENCDINKNGVVDREDLYLIEIVQIFIEIRESGELDINNLSTYETLRNRSYINNEEFKNFLKEFDFNDDNKINSADTEIFLQYIDEELEYEFDLNFDSNTTAIDASLFNQIVNGEMAAGVWSDPNGNNTHLEDEDFQIIKNILRIGVNDITEEEIIQIINSYTASDFDLNSDEVVNKSDLDIIENQFKGIEDNFRNSRLYLLETILILDFNSNGAYDSSDVEVANALDLNGDGKYTGEDRELFRELKLLNPQNESDINSVRNNTEIYDREGYAEHKYDNDTTTKDDYKYKNVVNVSNGDEVTYVIKVFNDGETNIYISEITDYMPNGVKYDNVSYSGEDYTLNFNISNNRNAKIFKDLEGKLLAPGQSATIEVTVEVEEPNKSLNVLQNTAKITKIKNTNGIEMDADESDTTPNNNTDSDYMKLNYPTTEGIISGYVWNDIAFNKEQNVYNGILDTEETKISKIKVSLHRVYDNSTTKVISTKYTDNNGYYSFVDSDINKFMDANGNVYEEKIVNSTEKYIKAPINDDNNRWNDEKVYYSYYVVFEYDGITYTSTEFTDVTSNNANDSNAKEDIGKVAKTRKEFNDNFSTINSASGITYTTKNEEGYIPESNHVYNPDKMAMQSSTTLISLDTVSEEQLKHVNLGLRGRDIFDLELTSDVDTIKVTVNNQQGVYKYTNKVSLRRNDLYNENSNDEYYYFNGERVPREDMANQYSQGSEYVGEAQNQNIRNSDYNVNANYSASQGISNIEVTYKITVQNNSITKGTATEITNYYDSKYELKEIIAGKNCGISSVEDFSSETGYSYVVIGTTGTTMLNQSETMELYVVYTLKAPIKDTLTGLTQDNPIPTYNMAEITEYRTSTTTYEDGTNNEATRGLIDKDSAPGSAASEKVRLHPNQIGNVSTVKYYFDAQELEKLKYEDDTYATPTLYFVIPSDTTDNSRIITGIVFRDETVVDATTKIKTGNGILDEGEVGVYGATVQLIELVEQSRNDIYLRDEKQIELNGKYYPVRASTTTGTDGSFTFTDFLPGNYIIRYYYGDSKHTIVLNQSEDGTVNKYSFNGEDYQSTNNMYNISGMDTNILKYDELEDNQKAFWYAYNEEDGISTAIDDADRRKEVSRNVLDEAKSDYIMSLINKARAGDSLISENGGSADGIYLMENTYMFADTEAMLFTVEKTELVEEGLKQREQFSEYKIENMNFGIAEVPITTIDLQKDVKAFTITDSTGNNVIASVSKDNQGKWKLQGDVLFPESADTIDVSVEDEKLQGAKLQVTYSVKSSVDIQINYDKTTAVTATIKGLVDIVDNNLSYNPNLGDNSKYWTLMTESLEKSSIGNVSTYSTILKATDDAIKNINEGNEATIILEKVLSSTDSTIDEIIFGTVDIYEYNNIVEITELDYENVTPEGTTPNPEGTDPDSNPNPDPEPQRDRVRTDDDGYIIIPGIQHDTESAEVITIHPPTGDSSINIMYYIIAAIALVILAFGIFGIKKFVLNNKE